VSLSAAPLVAVIALAVGTPLVLANRRFRAAWRALAARFPRPAAALALPPTAEASAYCEAHIGGQTVRVASCDVAVSAHGLTFAPGPWYPGLPSIWVPWEAVTACERTNRPLVRVLAPCVRVDVAEPPSWFLIDLPIGEHLNRLWHSRFRPGPARGEADQRGDAPGGPASRDES